jgi:hypothetical protein
MIGDDDLRDCFAMMLTVGFAMRGEINPKAIWEITDLIIEARNNKEPEVGIVAVKSRRRK